MHTKTNTKAPVEAFGIEKAPVWKAPNVYYL